MGEPVTTVALIAAAGSEVGSGYEQYKGEQSQENALALQSKEIALTTTQKTIANYDLISKTIKAQRAAESVRGVDMSSPSFDAIQAATLSKGAAVQEDINTESNIKQLNLKTEESNVRDKLYGDLFGDLTQSADLTAKLFSSAPRISDAAPQNISNVDEDNEDDEDNDDGE
jgi:hypothetical protein